MRDVREEHCKRNTYLTINTSQGEQNDIDTIYGNPLS